jgi:hypothetical protein
MLISAALQTGATAKPLTIRNRLTQIASFAVLATAFDFSLFCWPPMCRPLTRAHGWNFACANAHGSIVLSPIGVFLPFVGIPIDKFFDETRRWSAPFTVDLVLVCGGLLLVLVMERPTRPVATPEGNGLCVF